MTPVIPNWLDHSPAFGIFRMVPHTTNNPNKITNKPRHPNFSILLQSHHTTLNRNYTSQIQRSISCSRPPPRAISDLEISEALCQGVKGGKRVAPTELEDTKACRRGLLLLESTRLQYAMKTSLVGVISCSPAPFCCCGGRQSDVREHLQTSFNRGVRALSLARTPMLQSRG